MKNPCRGCDLRKPGCHATCEDYIAWKKEYDARQAKVRAEKELKWSVDEAREAAFRRWKKQK